MANNGPDKLVVTVTRTPQGEGKAKLDIDISGEGFNEMESLGIMEIVKTRLIKKGWEDNK